MFKIAVMQPYFFPYAGYFEMMAEVDRFVFLTDVQYIRRGWVNRNRIKQANGNGPMYFTVPVAYSPRSTLIKDMRVADSAWVEHHLKSFETAYGKNATDHPVYRYYSTLGRHGNLCDLLVESTLAMADYLDIRPQIGFSTEFPSSLRGKDRIIDLCKKYGADVYVNLPGGVQLYAPDEFARHGLGLEFMTPTQLGYLSILDMVFTDGPSNSLCLRTWTYPPSSPPPAEPGQCPERS